MIKVYISINQLNNFLILKEPVQLKISTLDERDVELLLNQKKLIFTEYSTYTTIELKTFRKVLDYKWKKLMKIFKK